jgi:hypothetical protein
MAPDLGAGITAPQAYPDGAVRAIRACGAASWAQGRTLGAT